MQLMILLAALAGTTTTPPPPSSYDQAIAAFRSIKTGMSSAQVLAALGEPTRRDGATWAWDFSKLKDFPPLAPGRQVFPSGAVTFDAQQHVAHTQLAWIDATGPAPKR